MIINNYEIPKRPTRKHFRYLVKLLADNGGKFKEINEAYIVLKDPKKRKEYDAMKRVQAGYQANFNNDHMNRSRDFKQEKMYSNLGSFTNINLDDIKDKKTSSKSSGKNKGDSNFSDFFELLFGKHKEEQRKSGSRAKVPISGDDFEMEVSLSLEDAHQGTIRKVEITRSNNATRRLEVTVPPGLREGNKIKVSNEGKPGLFGGANGDLYLIVRVKEHEYLRLEEDDIHSDLELRPAEAVLGSNKHVATVEGVVELVIPPKTQQGKTLRLRNKGMYNAKTKTRGDHYVHINIKIKDNYSDEELELFRKLKDID